VVETQPATIAEFGSPQTGPNGEPNRALLAAQAPLRLCSGPLRLCSGAAKPRLRVKQRLLRVEALTGAGEKKSYVRLLGSPCVCARDLHNNFGPILHHHKQCLLKPPSILSILQTGDFWDPETDTTKSHSLSSSLPLDQSSFLHLRRVARTKCLLIRTKHPFPSLLRKLCLGRGPAFGGVSQAHSTVQRGLSLYLLRVQKRRPSRT
jgi:hypothetical protein